jgi:hypothetical protein
LSSDFTFQPQDSDDLSYLHFIAPDGKELFPGGARMHVTAHNVTTYMHLVANYQLNCQVSDNVNLSVVCHENL